jgi:hypothetical protein
MSAFPSLESTLDDIFVKNLPALPTRAKQLIVQYLGWITLILGFLTLYTIYVLWQWAHTANALINYANSVGAAYGVAHVNTDRMGIGVWLGLLVLIVEAYLYISAYAPVRDHKKSGWDLIFYATIVNVLYGVAVLFSAYGNIGSLVGTIVGAAIAMYFLFQIRTSYLVLPSSARKRSVKKPV